MSRSLRPYLEYQADRVEATLSSHRVPSRVIGGTVGPLIIRFYLQPSPHIRFAQIQSLRDDLALALQTPHLNIVLDKGIILEFPNPNPQTITLTSLINSYGPLPVATAVLGLTSEGTPLCVRLSSPDVAHILIAGTTGCGKSNLLRAIAASLLTANTPKTLSLIAIDPKNRTFPPGFATPHLIRDVFSDPHAALEVLNSLVTLMTMRDQRGENMPHIAVIIDELANLVMAANGGIEQPLIRLVQSGRQTGIHVIAATQRPSAAIVSGLMRANFPLRLVGRTVSAEDSRIAAGRGGVGAERLSGRGDFVAVTGGENIRFQVPLVKADELPTIPRTTQPAPITLPTALAPAAPAPVPSDLDILTARLQPWWNQNHDRWDAQEWGIQKEAIGVLFPGDPNATNAGFWRETLFKVIAHLQDSKTTTTTHILPPSRPIQPYSTG